MRIAVIGAAGNVGSRVVAEALRRGHRVTPLTRDDVDVTDTDTVAGLIAGHDVGVGATRPVPGNEQSAPVITGALLDAHAAAGVRFVMVGGAGSLLVPDDAGRLVADDPRWVPPEIADLARTGNDQLTLCREHGLADWTYVTPSALMEPGLRTGSYRVGQDEMLVDSAGRSYVSMEDLAVAVLDEIEEPAHRGQRFTVASEAPDRERTGCASAAPVLCSCASGGRGRQPWLTGDAKFSATRLLRFRWPSWSAHHMSASWRAAIHQLGDMRVCREASAPVSNRGIRQRATGTCPVCALWCWPAAAVSWPVSSGSPRPTPTAATSPACSGRRCSSRSASG